MNLTVRNKAAFGLGALGKDIVYMFVANYLLYYYNAVLGMNASFIGAVMMGARVFDAFNDPLMGIVVAKTKTGFGKFRPWIFVGTVTNAITIYALFATPANMADSAQRLWLGIFYILWGVTYTLMDIPFWSMIPAITNPGKDREQLSSIARSFSGIGDAIPVVLTMVIVPILSNTTSVAGYTKGFKIWAIIIAVFFVISELVFVLNVPEKEVEMETVGVFDMFKALFRNDQAMTIVASIILVYSSLNIVGNLILYFFQYDVGNTDAYSVFSAVAFGTQVVIMMLFPMLRKLFDKTRLFMLGFATMILGFGVILLMAYTHIYKSTWVWLCIPGMLVYVGYGILNVSMTIFLSDSVDYGEWKNGSRDESVIFSMQTFTVKLASGLAVFLAGLIIDWVHLDTKAKVQTEATLLGMRLWMTIPSIILLIIGIFVYNKFYKLDDEKLEEISRDLEARQS